MLTLTLVRKKGKTNQNQLIWEKVIKNQDAAK